MISILDLDNETIFRRYWRRVRQPSHKALRILLDHNLGANAPQSGFRGPGFVALMLGGAGQPGYALAVG